MTTPSAATKGGGSDDKDKAAAKLETTENREASGFQTSLDDESSDEEQQNKWIFKKVPKQEWTGFLDETLPAGYYTMYKPAPPQVFAFDEDF